MERANLVNFVLARVLVSSSLSMAMQASPDLLFGPHRSKEESIALSAQIDFFNTLLQFFARPVWGSAMDSFGRKPVLVFGLLLSTLARSTVSYFPTSSLAYFFYRILNANSLLPVMQASSLLVLDFCGNKREGKVFLTLNRRLFMLLAVVRIISTRIAARMAQRGQKPETIMLCAAGLTTASSLLFAFTVKEVRLPTGEFSVLKAWQQSTLFFFHSRTRALLALMLVLRMLPGCTGSLMTSLQQTSFNWTAKDRAFYSNVSDAAEVLMPLVIDEMLRIKPPLGKQALRWGSRFQALSLLNIAFSPYPNVTLVANEILGRLVTSQPFFDRELDKEQCSMAEVTASLSTLEFPVSLGGPMLVRKMANVCQSDRAPFALLAFGILINSEVLIHLFNDSK